MRERQRRAKLPANSKLVGNLLFGKSHMKVRALVVQIASGYESLKTAGSVDGLAILLHNL